MTADEGHVPLPVGAASGESPFEGLSEAVKAALPGLFRRAALVFLPLAGLITLVFFFVIQVAHTTDRAVLESGQRQIVQLGRTSINATLNALMADISYLGNEETLQTWLATGDPIARSRLARQYLVFLTHKRQFDRIRFIDADGSEQVHADRPGGTPRIVPDDELPWKLRRAHFTDAETLARGEIVISPFRFDAEASAAGQAAEARIEVATPAYDGAGVRRGIVSVDYLGNRIVDQIRTLEADSAGEIWLVDSEGSWLSRPRAETEHEGPTSPELRNPGFAAAFPAAWEKISGSPGFAQFSDRNGMFSSAPLFAPATSEDGVIIAKAPVWYLVAQAPQSLLAAKSAGAVPLLASGWAASMLLLAAAALFVAYREGRRQPEGAASIGSSPPESEALLTLTGELDAFSYAVSHDLRTPLRAIDGFCKALLDDCSATLGEAGRNHLARVRAAAQRMGDLIDGIVTLVGTSRAEISIAGGVDLTAIATGVVENLRRLDQSREVKFLTTPGMRARCDPRMMQTALENLIDNAWKFTAERKPAIIQFGVTQSGAAGAFFVRDNGIGFDMAHTGKLFGAFQRLHTDDARSGTGIGLATVARIIKKHGGRVWAEAMPDRGATLFFTL